MNPETELSMGVPARHTRRPRIALMGEFSAGKSTLANLLLGQSVSPVKVTATQLPPVWYAHGAEAVARIDNEGTEVPIGADELNAISHRDTQAVRISLETDVLEFCDVIDMPGTSDPNMPQEVWQRMLNRVDGVVWCTPATQAWRQTEAALWEQLPSRLHPCSLLLVTRMDMLKSKTDRDRVLARVRREAADLFRKVLPISLTEAIEAEEDEEVLERCGADDFVASLVDLVTSFEYLPPATDRVTFDALSAAKPERAEAAPAQAPAPAPLADGRVMPRRIAPKRAKPVQEARQSLS